MSDPLKRETKALTVNNLPKDLVVEFKSLAARLDVKIEDLMELALVDAIKKGDGFTLDAHALTIRRKLEQKQRKEVAEETKRLQEKVQIGNAADSED